jgi:integrase
MRVGELAALQLDDLDWRAGECAVRESVPSVWRCRAISGSVAQHFGRLRNAAVSFSQSSQPADFAIARDSSGEG